MQHTPDISIIITAHHEGLLAGVSAQSAQAAAACAHANGLTCEYVVVLDNADALTSATLRQGLNENATFLETSEGDPGLARNQGLEAAKGTYAAYLDADDLWSENWLVEAAKLVEQRPDAVAQCACAVAFGDERHLWWHQDSETDLCDPAYLEWMNYWDALVFARRDLLAKYPYHANDLKLGYGHEDWHWNRVTLEAGVPHKPVPRTIHFKRKRCGTQSTLVDKVGGMPWTPPETIGFLHRFTINSATLGQNR